MSADKKNSHPRRRSQLSPLKTDQVDSCCLPTGMANDNTKQTLRKSATFQASRSPTSEYDPILSIPSIPKRSPTCPKALEDTLARGDQRIVQLLGAVDRSLSGLQSFSELRDGRFEEDESPIPRFMVGSGSGNDCMDVDSDEEDKLMSEIKQSVHTFPRRRHHSSDSGIGSSESSEASVAGDRIALKTRLASVAGLAAGASLDGAAVKSGINGSGASLTKPNGAQNALSEYACKQIQKHIIVPIIREESLKNFHPLVSGIPYRVARKEITCLRDLEKVLLWLAPKWSNSKASFINFCETSIQCIHATVEFLNESDQRRPTDRPYTNGYFLDLVEQIRQYASTLAATRERIVSRSDGSIGDSTPERVTIVGGLGQTGRPAELVKVKNGHMISLRTSEEVSPECSGRAIKRPSEGEFEEDALRSMARRRKSLGPVAQKVQQCNECDKVFKRPCDLTKHEKTHSRPWKCSEVGCKYYEYGWPTEKERDRHMNDKHSSSPNMFKCHFSPCPYESKRESNCKQHMEKAHGWVYIRSKHNGKNGKQAPSSATPNTPQVSTPGSYSIEALSPNLSDVPNHLEGPPEIQNHTPAPSEIPEAITGDREIYRFNETFGPIEDTFWNGAETALGGPHISQLIQNDRGWETPGFPNGTGLSTNSEDESLFGASFDWSNMEHDLATANAQLITPATSVNNTALDSFSRRASASIGTSPQHPHVASISPGGQGDAMLYSPYSMNEENTEIDEGFEDFVQDPNRRPVRDFSLYGSGTGSRLSAVAGGNMFDDITTFSTQSGWPSRGDMERPGVFDESLLPVDE